MTTNAGTTAGTGAAAAKAGGGAVRAAGHGAGAPVALHDLSRSFGAVRALHGLSLDIAPGELVALLGPSGCGKTTALRILAGFEYADTGTVSVDGQEISRVPAAKRDMGMVFQSYSLFPNMTALDNVGFGLRMRKLRAGERNRRAGELLDLVGLADQARKYPHQMSGGQQQRVALARALAIEPRVLLLDEPLSALDAKVRLQLREQIRSLQQRLGITTLFVTHDQEEALSMADRVGVMKDGKLEQVAVPGQLYAEPATAFVAEFVGIMNRIPGQRQGQDQVSALGAVVPVRGGTAGGSGGSSPRGGTAGDSGRSGDVDVLVRPEGLRIAVQPGGNGIVTDRTFLGSVTRVSVLLSGDVTVKVDQPTAVADTMPLGTSVQVSLPGEAVLVTGRR
jgi:putative spermidine/putrescine transport system ATP-binding protein